MAIISGTDMNDTLACTDDADQIFGRAGNDTIDGRSGDEVIMAVTVLILSLTKISTAQLLYIWQVVPGSGLNLGMTY